MHGLGNDFVVLSGSDLYKLGGQELVSAWEEHAPKWAQILCDRRFGIGADALVVIFDLNQAKNRIPDFVQEYPRTGHARFAWTYTNQDGSWSKVCGNALRCVAWWLKYQGLVEATNIEISTALGDTAVNVVDRSQITIDLGEPMLHPTAIPLKTEQDNFISQPIEVAMDGERFTVVATCVGMGNPHCVVFDDVRETILPDLTLGSATNSDK